MTKQEVLNAIEAKKTEFNRVAKELESLRNQLKRIEQLEAIEETKKEEARKQQQAFEAQKLAENKTVEEMLAAQIESEKLKAFQDKLLMQEHEEKCKQNRAEFEARRIANPILNYTKKEVRGSKVETYTWETHTGGDCEKKVIVKWDKIEVWTYGSKTSTYIRTGNYWTRTSDKRTIKHTKNVITNFVPEELLATLPTKKK